MKKNINYYEEDIPNEKIELNAVELSDLIEETLSVKGRRSRTKVLEINKLIEEYGEKYGKVYNKLQVPKWVNKAKILKTCNRKVAGQNNREFNSSP